MNRSEGQIKRMNKILFSAIFTCSLVILISGQVGAKEVIHDILNSEGFSEIARQEMAQVNINEKQVLEINRSLKNVIEENQQLSDKNQRLNKEVRRLKNEKASVQNRYKNLKQEQQVLSKKLKNESLENRKISREINRLKLTSSKSRTFGMTSSVMTNSSDDEVMMLASSSAKEVRAREKKTLDLLSRIDAFAEKDEKLRSDSAKAHYNMGNIYFQRGEFDIAAREYYQAVTLLPDDPDSHYNLAFVSGEHLEDYKTALKHYRIYLYLNPRAKDKHFVREKMLHADLKLRSLVDSPLEKKNKN